MEVLDLAWLIDSKQTLDPILASLEISRRKKILKWGFHSSFIFRFINTDSVDSRQIRHNQLREFQIILYPVRTEAVGF